MSFAPGYQLLTEQKKSFTPLTPGVLQRASINSSKAHDVPPIVHEVLRSLGQPLDTETRAFMEPRFGHDFSGVRVHTDAEANDTQWCVNIP
jgi:hypothetical protein